MCVKGQAMAQAMAQKIGVAHQGFLELFISLCSHSAHKSGLDCYQNWWQLSNHFLE